MESAMEGAGNRPGFVTNPGHPGEMLVRLSQPTRRK
jgi:hypothetical protein